MQSTAEAAPTQASARIVSLDVLRGFALLGILLLNIVGMGMLSSAYYYPLGGAAGLQTSALDINVWMVNELFTEGVMRALFSMLFGAGVLLFTQSRSGELHFRRTFWLLCFGLFDAYVLMWTGDILVVYAIGSVLLYFVRNATTKSLLRGAVGVLGFLILIKVFSVVGLRFLETESAELVKLTAAGDVLSGEQQEQLDGWLDFKAGALLNEEEKATELAARGSTVAALFAWSREQHLQVLVFALPVFLLWDALAMMLLGMVLYRWSVLQGELPHATYGRLAIIGLAVGLSINGFEVWRAINSNYDIVTSFSLIQPTYDIGRTAMALGYIGLVVWCCKSDVFTGLLARLAAVGRMALTNYLMHSAFALVLFTGAGFGLVGTFDRWMLYPIVLGIWLFQLWFSPWWLARHPQGPLETLWRRLTYGSS